MHHLPDKYATDCSAVLNMSVAGYNVICPSATAMSHNLPSWHSDGIKISSPRSMHAKYKDEEIRVVFIDLDPSLQESVSLPQRPIGLYNWSIGAFGHPRILNF